MAKEFYKDDEYVYIGTEYAEAYIPEELFPNQKKDDKVSESAVAYEYGTSIMCIGVFYMRFFDDESAPRDSAPLRTFCYPSLIETRPTDMIRHVKLNLTGEEDSYRVLRYYKGDVMMQSAIKKNVRAVEQFTNLITSGKIPSSLSYPEIFHTWLRNFDINGIDPSVPSVVMQMIIATICRVKDDPDTEFRMVAGKPGNVDLHSYRTLNMNQISARSSTMSALSFERYKEKVVSSLNMEKEGIEQPISPVEKVLGM